MKSTRRITDLPPARETTGHEAGIRPGSFTPAVAAKAGAALEIPELVEFADSAELAELEDAAAEFLAGVKDVLSVLSGGIDGERSEARARVEQAGSRLNSLESEVKLVINALGVDTAGALPDAAGE